MPSQPDVLVVGAGIFGASAALELHRRGISCALLDPGPLPHELAASTDISKVLRMEYGADDDYMDWMIEAFEGWRSWNSAWQERGIGPLFHETGVLMMARDPLSPGGFEFESHRRLLQRGLEPERLDTEQIRMRFPAWSTGHHVDGFYHGVGGWAESGKVVNALLAEGRESGVEIRAASMAGLELSGDRVVGVRDQRGDLHGAGQVVLATGAWTGALLPELANSFSASGHPVFHLRPERSALFAASRFPVFTADISRTGFYGFPLHPSQGVVKIATHAVGREIDPRSPREVKHRHELALREFLRDCLPELAEAEIVYRRLCLYSDTRDENLWIDRHEHRAGLIVASGGSGHGFKFAPLLGPWIADLVEGKPGAPKEKFRWRSELESDRGTEAARCHDLE